MDENLKVSNLDKIFISSPMGGFVNHVGWLIFSNSKFDSTLIRRKITKEHYNFIKGSSWPAWEKLEDQNYINEHVDKLIIKELSEFQLIDKKINNKISFILDNVYCNKRNLSNWLTYEFKYREFLKNITIGHFTNNVANCYNIFCYIDPDVAYKYYSIMLDRTLDQDKFFKEIKEYNVLVKEKINREENILVLNNNLLNKEILDHDYYNQLINFLNLNDDYEQAKIVHKAWMSCRIAIGK